MSLRFFLKGDLLTGIGISHTICAHHKILYNAIENKLAHPHKRRWIDISYESGYFDQMHFIKEVKTFSSV